MPSVQLVGSRGAGINGGAKKKNRERDRLGAKSLPAPHSSHIHDLVPHFSRCAPTKWTPRRGYSIKQSRQSHPTVPLRALLRRFYALAPIFARPDKKLIQGLYCNFQYSSLARVALLSKSSPFSSISLPVLKERLDYTLREGYMENNYWSAVTSHVSYWSSCDVARFIIENCLDSTQAMDQS